TRDHLPPTAFQDGPLEEGASFGGSNPLQGLAEGLEVAVLGNCSHLGSELPDVLLRLERRRHISEGRFDAACQDTPQDIQALDQTGGYCPTFLLLDLGEQPLQERFEGWQDLPMIFEKAAGLVPALCSQ